MPKFFNLAADDRIMPEIKNPLHRAVCVYLNNISASNYEPGVVEGNWNGNQISAYIDQLLANFLAYFEDRNVPETIETSVPCIAHLAASLSCINDIAELPPAQHFYQLKKTGAFSLVHAGMPGPCLIYLQALLAAPEYDAISKMMLFGNVIDSLMKRGNHYGILAAVALPVVIEKWFLFLETLTAKQQDVLSGKVTFYRGLQEECSKPLIKEHATFIDECIINVWEKLHIDYDLNAVNGLYHRNM